MCLLSFFTAVVSAAGNMQQFLRGPTPHSWGGQQLAGGAAAADVATAAAAAAMQQVNINMPNGPTAGLAAAAGTMPNSNQMSLSAQGSSAVGMAQILDAAAVAAAGLSLQLVQHPLQVSADGGEVPDAYTANLLQQLQQQGGGAGAPGGIVGSVGTSEQGGQEGEG